MDYISEEVLAEEILVRLPIKSLVRFKSGSKRWQSLVRFKSGSKRWRSLIRSRSFVDLYDARRRRLLDSSAETQRMLLVSPYATTTRKMEKKPVRLDFITLAPGPPGLLLPPKLTRLKRPPEDDLDDEDWTRAVRVLGPLPSGIYCLMAHHHKEIARRVSMATAKIALCNPATGDYKLLPPLPLDESDNPRCRIHLGFGNVGTDYKVVVIASPFSRSFIYSLQRGSWSEIEAKNTAIQPDFELCPQRLLMGRWHWLASSNSAVLSFDFGDDTFKLMASPPGCSLAGGGGVLVLKDHLAVISVSFSFPTTLSVVVWMMMEYGVGESWTMIYAYK